MKQVLIACLFALGASSSFAFDPPYCSGISRISFSPANPGPTDPIGIWNAANWAPVGWTPTSGSIVSLATVDVTQSKISLDVIFAPDVGAFPTYKVVDPYGDSPYALVGPLGPGTYHVSATVRMADAATGAVTPVCPNAPTQTATLIVLTQAASTQTAPLIEFYNAGLDHYFMSQDPKEISYLDTGVYPGWVRTGQNILAYTLHGSDNRGRQVSRYYAPPSTGINSHFYTASNREIEGMEAAAMLSVWGFEGIVFEIPTPDTQTGMCLPGQTSVYRLWNARSDNAHRYTIDPLIRDQMIARGWVTEGYGPNAVVMCAPNQ